jgi:hypothetical protein
VDENEHPIPSGKKGEIRPHLRPGYPFQLSARLGNRGSPVSHYAAPFEFTGKLIKAVVTMDDDQILNGDGVGRARISGE